MADQNATTGAGTVVLHGFTQTGRCIGPLGEALATATGVVCPDLPGHGRSGSLFSLDLPGTASHLASAIGPTLDGPAVWVGYSMGGRVALHVALGHPRTAAGLVLISATAGIADADERAERAAADAVLADHIEHVGVDAFLEGWLDRPMFATLPAWARFDDERRRNTVAGLAGSLRNAGTGSMAPLWDRLRGVDLPVLCITGGDDDRFTRLGARLVDALPDARLEVVAGAGHAVHLERPAEVSSLVVAFCEQVAPRRRDRVREPGPRWYQRSPHRG